MKTLHYNFCLFVLLLSAVAGNAATYTWSAQVAGSLTYTTGNMSAVITNTNFNTTGPQNPNGGANNGYKSPKYVSTATINTYQGGFTNDYGMPGLVLGVDWSNLNSSTTLTITFANPVAGPVSFNIYDINTGSWGGYDPVWSDRVAISGTNCAGNYIAPVITGCAPTLPNGTNIITGTQSCTNQTNTVTFNATGIKSITIVYSSNSPLASGYGNDPDPQYIIISDITYNNFTPFTVLNQPWQNLSCTHQSVTLMPSPLVSGTSYAWSNGATGFGSTTVQQPGPYTVTATDQAGCITTATAYVGIDTAKPTVTVNPSTATITCATAGSALTAQSPNANLAYLWNDGDTTLVNLGNVAGVYTVTVTDKANGCTASASATVSVDTLHPTVQIVPPDTLSCANPTVTLTATSPNSGVIYIWPGGLGSGPVKTVSAPGMYYVLVSIVSNGCSASDTVYVQQSSSTADAAIAPPGALTCTNTSVTLSAVNTTQTATYTWNTGATGPTLTVTQPGTYTLIVSSAGGNCADTSSVTVTQNNAPPSLQVNPTSAVLDCSTTTATFTASTNAANATYNWSNAQTTSNITVNTAGTYAVTVTDAANGCNATASATVTQTATPPTVTIQSSGGIDCANAQVTLTANTATSNVTYTWSNAGTASTTTVTTAGTYTVTVTDPANGCTASATTTVTSSSSSIIVNINTPGELTCANNSIALTATSNANNYAWSTGETTSNINVTQPGTYTVTAASGVNCSGTATVAVAQNTQTPLVSIGPPQVITCFNPSVALVTSPTSPDYIYVWNTGEQTANITVTTANNYVVTVTDNTNGCSATSAMPVAENTTPPAVTVNNGELNCRVSVDTLIATATGNVSFMWNTGSGNDFIYVTTEGTYTVTVTDSDNGCTATAQGTVVSINSVLSLNAYASGTLTEETTEVDITAASNATLPAFSWSNGDSTAITTVTEPGDYSVTVTDNSTGCTASVTVNVLQNLSNNIFVPNAFTPNGDGNNDVFSIYGSIKNIGFLQVQVFNRWGEKVFESNDHHFAWDGTYKGQLQNPGVYVWQLTVTFTNGQVDELRKGSLTILK